MLVRVPVAVLVLLFVTGAALGDITGTNPPFGTCLCAEGSGINVRDAGCGTIVGTISSPNCYKYLALRLTCTLNGVSYQFFKIDWGADGGWVAGTYLNQAADSYCSSSSGGCPNIVTRAQWGARSPTSVTYISKPVPKVFVHHTAGATCTTQSGCSAEVRAIQNYHMDVNGWSDIGYNFLIGEDGNVYEGRGWDRVGAHASDYNSVSIGMSVMGTYSSRLPNAAALNALNQIIDCGTTKGVSSSYTLHGHRDGGCTECPGQALYDQIKTWPHYGGKLAGSCTVYEKEEFMP